MDWRQLPILRNDKLLFENTADAAIPGTIAPCLLCCKPFLVRPYIGSSDQLCPECWKTYDETARVICSKCNITVCRALPKILDCGYYIRPRSVLRIDACNICRPGLKESVILEIDSWIRNIRGKKIILPPGANWKK